MIQDQTLALFSDILNSTHAKEKYDEDRKRIPFMQTPSLKMIFRDSSIVVKFDKIVVELSEKNKPVMLDSTEPSIIFNNGKEYTYALGDENLTDHAQTITVPVYCDAPKVVLKYEKNDSLIDMKIAFTLSAK